jgi:hypothetical protein
MLNANVKIGQYKKYKEDSDPLMTSPLTISLIG